MVSGCLLRDVRQRSGIAAVYLSAVTGRYTSIPSLAHVADGPALGLTRFEPCRIIVAVNASEGSVIGFAMTRQLDELLYLDNISVALDESGRGIGAGLLSEVLSYGRAIEAPALTLTNFPGAVVERPLVSSLWL